MQRNVAQVIDDRPLGSLQVITIALCALVLVLDGYDIGTISSTAPLIAESIHVQVSTFGPIFSAAFVGILIGALIFGTVADRVGRKPTVVAATLTFGLFTLTTPFAHDYTALLWMRLLTGVGLGGAVPNAAALTSEYVPSRLRAFAVNVISAGIAVGGVCAPVLTSILLPHYSWRATFFLGGIFPCVLAVVMYAVLPESLRFLAVRNPCAPRVRRLVTRLDPALAASDITIVAEMQGRTASFAALFAEGRGRATILLWVQNFCSLLIALLMVSWLPAILREVGLTMATGLLIASLFSVGGIVGTVLLGYTMIRRAPCMVLALAFLCAAVAVAAFGSVGASRPLLSVVIFFAGFFVLGSQAAVIAVAAGVYPTASRSTGVGWTLGVGRLGSIVGPVIAGLLLAGHWGIASVFVVAVVPALIGAVAAFLLHRVLSARFPRELISR